MNLDELLKKYGAIEEVQIKPPSEEEIKVLFEMSSVLTKHIMQNSKNSKELFINLCRMLAYQEMGIIEALVSAVSKAENNHLDQFQVRISVSKLKTTILEELLKQEMDEDSEN